MDKMDAIPVMQATVGMVSIWVEYPAAAAISPGTAALCRMCASWTRRPASCM